MRYVITGTSGMLASVLDAELMGSGHERVVPPPSMMQWVSPSSGQREPDFRERRYLTWLREADWDMLIHAGALVGTTRCEAEIRSVWSCNVAGAVALAEVVKEKNHCMIYCASDSEFDPDDYGRGNPIRVDFGRVTTPNPHSRYGMSKVAARMAIEALLEDNVLSVYPCFGFGGALDGNSCVAEILKCASGMYDRNPIIPLDPKALKEVTSHAHIAHVIVEAIEVGRHGRIPASSGRPIAYGDVVDLLRSVTGKTIEPDWRPELDYKRDLLYDPEAVADANSGIDAPDLRSELEWEWKAVLGYRDGDEDRPIAVHEWGHLDALRRK